VFEEYFVYNGVFVILLVTSHYLLINTITGMAPLKAIDFDIVNAFNGVQLEP
jgi:hypothetical protein